MFKPGTLAFVVIVSLLLVAAPVHAQAPGAPQNLTANVSGSNVTLSWSAPASGGSPTGYSVEAAIAPGGAAIATLSVSGISITVPGVPNGTYYVRVRASNGSGTGPVSNEVTVSVGGACTGAPLPPSLRVRSVGPQAVVTWGSSGGCAPTNYVLSAGSAPGLSDIVVVNAGGELGLSAIAPPGTYYVRVAGSNSFGTAVSQELTVRVAVNAQTDTLTANQAVAFDFLVTQTGNYDAVLIWDDPSVNLDLFLTTAGCPVPPAACLLTQSTAVGTSTEQVSRAVTAGQTYRVWVTNVGARTTSFTIFNTIGGVPVPSAAAVAASSRAPGQ